MIESSFCFLSGVGLRTERRFWREGVVTWEDFLNTQSLPRISGVRKSRFDEDIAQARDHFARQDVRYFARTVPARHQWRLYGHGIYTALIRGESLDWRRLAEELSHYELLVTFCGTSFDLPCSPLTFPTWRSISPISTSVGWAEH